MVRHDVLFQKPSTKPVNGGEDTILWEDLMRLTIALAAGFAALSTAAAAQPPAAPPARPAATAAPLDHADYGKGENWVCRPNRQDPCANSLDATIVSADGSTKREDFVADPNAPIDCFYIYPTVSNDPFSTSDLVPGPEERSVVNRQFSRLGAKCRLYAPMYRQITLTQLRVRSGGAAPPQRGAPGQGNADIDDAWDYYMKHDNNGRGVVLIGHSQGAGQVARLIREKIDGQPAQKQLVGALIIGGSVTVPKGKDVGGTFKAIPICKSDKQFGCVIAYGSYRDTLPPPAQGGVGAGRVTADSVGVCVNPAAIAGGKAQPKSYWAVEAPLNASLKAPPRWSAKTPLYTPFAVTPGLVTTECVEKDGKTYLQVHVNAVATDARADDIYGDVMLANGQPDPGWGLHNVDMNLSMGAFLDVVGRWSAAWRAANK